MCRFFLIIIIFISFFFFNMRQSLEWVQIYYYVICSRSNIDLLINVVIKKYTHIKTYHDEKKKCVIENSYQFSFVFSRKLNKATGIFMNLFCVSFLTVHNFMPRGFEDTTCQSFFFFFIIIIGRSATIHHIVTSTMIIARAYISC